MNRTNQILAAIFGVLLVLVFALENPFQKSKYETTESKGAPLFPAFNESLAAKIEIKRGDGESAVLKKDASGVWILDNLFGYPADQGRVFGERSLLADVRKMMNTELVDSDPSDLDKPYNLGAKNGVEVRISDAAGATLAEFVQGKLEGDMKDPDFQRRFSRMASYVRTQSGKGVYLVAQFPPLATAAKDWISKNLLSFSVGKVQEMHLAGEAVGGEIALQKDGEEWSLTKPEAAKAKKEVVDAMLRTMSSASFRELVGALDDPAKYELANPQLKVAVKLEGGQELALWVGKQLEDKSYFVSKGDKDKFVYQAHSYLVDGLKKTLADLKDMPPPPAPPEIPQEEPVKPQ